MAPTQVPVDSDDTASSLSSMTLPLGPGSGDIVDIHARITDTHETPEIDLDSSDASSDTPKPEKRLHSRARAKRLRKTSSNPSVPTPTLRPAKDILSRIRHDPSIDNSDYIVGYHDRIEGPMEMKVEDWKGGDVTDEEFIPQHRILYFRRASDGVRVWDRKRRLDVVFGSGVPRGLTEENEDGGKDSDVNGDTAEAEVEDEDDGGVEISMKDSNTNDQGAQDSGATSQGVNGPSNPPRT